ncbi:MAG TPA: FtsQ-type POTRA domain-containing protein [Edaphobacter sp.]
MLDAPEQDYASEFSAPRRSSPPQSSSPSRMRRDLAEDFADAYEEETPVARRNGGVRLRLRGGLPRTRWGRIAAGTGLLVFIAACTGAFMMARSALMHDDRFAIPSSASIEVQGNEHVTRAQLLSIFGEDVERNIFRVPLEERKAQLERLPWVEHATVMRLLPNRLRVAIVERAPVAFVRQGNHIGLVDASGVLLDIPTDVQANMKYSFPVITGIAVNDPLSVRSARMKIYQRFTSDLDSGGEKISGNLSEVDLSDPEDVRALIPDRGGEVLVHFGEDSFLERYKKFEEHLPEWRTQYPGLSSVDMRYEQQVVLQMKPATPASAAPGNGAVQTAPSPANGTVANRPPAPAAPRPKSTPAHKPAAKPAAHAKPVVKHVPPKKPAPQPLYHPPQVVRP